MDKRIIRSVSIINTILLLFVFITNICIAILRQSPDNLLIVSIFILFFLSVLSIYVTITKNKLFMGFIYIIIGILCTLWGGPGNLSGIIFIIFALCVYRSTSSIYIIVSLLSIALLGKAIFSEFNIFETINILIMYVGIYFIFYFLIFEKVVKGCGKNKRK